MVLGSSRNCWSRIEGCSRAKPPLLTALCPSHLQLPTSKLQSVSYHSTSTQVLRLTEIACPASHTLPYYPAHLLVASYLASHNPPKHDITLFSKSSLSKRRKRGGGTALIPHRASKHRKISRKLLGPQPFPLERLFAIFHAILPHTYSSGGADIICQLATLVGLRLIVKSGGAGDILEWNTKWRVNVGWEFVRDVARGVAFDVESYIIE